MYEMLCNNLILTRKYIPGLKKVHKGIIKHLEVLGQRLINERYGL